MKIIIWSPLISDDVGTVGTVLNTAKSIKKFSKGKYNISVLNVANEWKNFKNFFLLNSINLIDLGIKLSFDRLPRGSFFKSRFTYILISLLSISRLHLFLKKEQPEYFFIHLITFAPLFLINIFNYKTKFILRISGYPRLNSFRKFFWRLSNKRINKIFCPTIETKKQLIKEKIFNEDKIYVVHEPILDFEKIRDLYKKKNDFDYTKHGNYIVTVGRLTKQKNHKFLINCFDKILNFYPDLKLVICGEGEQKKNLEKLIFQLNRERNIFLLGFKKNIIPILKNSLFFTLTSEWEDPGFVIIESMFFNTLVYSSDCKNGPVDLIQNQENGFLFKKNDQNDYIKKFCKIYEMINKKNKSINKIKYNAKQKTKLYTLLYHYKNLDRILN